MLVEILHVLEPLQSEGEVPVVEYRGEGELEGRWAACPDYLTKHLSYHFWNGTRNLPTTNNNQISEALISRGSDGQHG